MIASRYCRSCGQQRAAEWSGPNHGKHFVLTLVTAGLWLWIWLPLALFGGKWICRECGSTCRETSRTTLAGSLAKLAFWLFALAFFACAAWLAWKVNHGG